MTQRMYRALVLLVVAAAIVLAVAWRLQTKPRSGSPTVGTTAAANDREVLEPPVRTDEPVGEEPGRQPTPSDVPEATGDGPDSGRPASVDTSTTPEYPAVIDLGMGKCIACKEMKPILEELAEEYRGRARIEIIDIGDHPDQADKYRVMLIPTQVFLDKDGDEVSRHEGFMPKEDIIAKLRDMGVE